MAEQVRVTQVAVTYANSPSVEDLQLQLRSSEGDIKLIALKVLDTGVAMVTEGIFEVTDENMTLRKLRLALDPAGTLAPGNGEERVCSGHASINLEATRVAAFRPVAA
jgi:hypothetical protein